jgi:tetratricopeptide (TPR) repeat protein
MDLRLVAPLLSMCFVLGLAPQAREATSKTSLDHFNAGEALFAENNYQSAALEFAAALKGDLQPKWIEVWSHVELGKIFDATLQRDRAVRQYKLAQETNDNTRGALDEAAKYLKEPFQK